MGISDELQKLEDLHSRGALSQEEFELAKGRLLGGPRGAPPRGPNKGLIVGVGLIGLILAFLLVVPVLGILAAIAIPNFVAMQYRAKRAELAANIDGIRTAEMAYDAAFDSFVAVQAPVPRAPSSLDAEPVPWVSGSAFDTLGWGPDGLVRGIYWVEVAPGGQDFTVHGLIDVDGDGEAAHYTATGSSNATQVTPSDVF